MGPSQMRARFAAWPVVCLLLLGCTTTSYNPEVVAQPPPTKTSIIAVGPISAKDEDMWHNYAVMVRRGLTEQLTKLRGTEHVVVLQAGASVPDALTINGELIEFDKGDLALRWIIGFGAGQAHATGRLQVADPAGAVLVRFTTTKGYAGGAGIGGADLLDADELARQLGEKAADAIDRWLKNGTLPAQ